MWIYSLVGGGDGVHQVMITEIRSNSECPYGYGNCSTFGNENHFYQTKAQALKAYEIAKQRIAH